MQLISSPLMPNGPIDLLRQGWDPLQDHPGITLTGPESFQTFTKKTFAFRNFAYYIANSDHLH